MSSQEVRRRLPLVGDLCCSPVLQAVLEPEDALVLAGALKVLAEPARLRLLSLIRSAEGGRATTGVLAEELGLTQPTITHHLGALFEAGFLERERDGRQTWYWVNTDGLQTILQLLDPAPSRELVSAVPAR
jgi:ArsR family transcriptional regulator